MANITFLEILFILLVTMVFYVMALEYKAGVFAVMGMIVSMYELANFFKLGFLNVTVALGFSSGTFSPFTIDGTVILFVLVVFELTGSYISIAMFGPRDKEDQT